MLRSLANLKYADGSWSLDNIIRTNNQKEREELNSGLVCLLNWTRNCNNMQILTLDISLTNLVRVNQEDINTPKTSACCLILLTLGWYYLSLLLRNLYDLHLAGSLNICASICPFFYKEKLKLLVPSLFPNIQASECCFLKTGPCCVA